MITTTDSVSVQPGTDLLGIIDKTIAFGPRGGLYVPGSEETIPGTIKLFRAFGARNTWLAIDSHPLGHLCLASSYVGIKPNTTVLAVTDAASRKKLKAELKLAPHAKFNLDYLVDEYLPLVQANTGGGQMLWSDHGIFGTDETELVPELAGALKDDPPALVLVKGNDPLSDSYSAVYDARGHSTGIASVLPSRAQRHILVGDAFDYCVGFTALDLRKLGYEVYIVTDLTRSVGQPEGSIMAMFARLVAAGVHMVNSHQLVFE